MTEIKFVELNCQRCGGALEQNGDTYICKNCGKKWQMETLHDFTDMLEACDKALQAQRIADIANLRQLLWKEISKEYVSNIQVERLCRDIQKYLPNDFYANFYISTCGESKTKLGDFLYNVNLREHYDDIPLVLEYLLKSLKPEWVLGVGNFIEKIKNLDTALYFKYRTRFEKEYEKVEEGVFEADLKRDVFIAYSSKDMPKVMELVAALEDEGLMCFVAARNMRHGSGSVENYRKLLHTAIDSCTVFVFVSSNNSRSFNCDAYREEISYIEQHRKDMPRVEYLIQNYSGKAVERNFKIFFSGLEYCLSPESVLERVTDILMNGLQTEEDPAPVETTVVETPVEEPVAMEQSVPASKPVNNIVYDNDLAKQLKQLKRARILIENGNFNEATSVISKIESGEEARVGACEIPEVYHYKLLIEYAARNDDELIEKLIEKQVDITKNINYRFAMDYAEESKNAPELKALISIKVKAKNAIAEAERIAREQAEAAAKAEQERIARNQVEREARTAQDCQIENGVLIRYKGNDSDIIIPDGVTSIGVYAFYNCKSLTSITLPDGVTSIGEEAFRGCESLTSITLPEGVTSIGEFAFYYCESLVNIIIPNSVTSIGCCAFRFCSSLKNITLSNGLTSIGEWVFYDCKSLTSINVSSDNKTYKSIDGNLYSFDGKTLMQYAIGKTAKSFTVPDGVSSIGKEAFRGCKSLASIIIPNGVTSIGESAFSDCKKLISATISNSVISIDESAFSGCESLTIIVIPNGVTSIGKQAFYNCKSLTNITIPNGVTSIRENTFSLCSSLTRVTIPNSVTSIGKNAFSICESLTSITIPNGVTSIGAYVFGWCKSLKSVTIPNSVTSIGESAFHCCESLTDITIPKGVTSIGESAFCYCESLTDITIPKGVTSIGESAFFNCKSLTSITIPNSVTSIGSGAFWDCKSLKTVYCEAVSKPEGWDNRWLACNAEVVWGYKR